MSSENRARPGARSVPEDRHLSKEEQREFRRRLADRYKTLRRVGQGRIPSDEQSRQRAAEALMEGFALAFHGRGCQCSSCRYLAGQMVDTVIEAWRGR